MSSRTHRFAFTLIELLVVIAVIALLLGLLIPVLGRAREQARRVSCMGNIRQFIIGIQAYSSDHGEHLPSGLSDFQEPQDEHTPILSKAMRDALVEIIGDEKSLSCPWLRKPFDQPGGWYYVFEGQPYGYVIGYNRVGIAATVVRETVDAAGDRVKCLVRRRADDLRAARAQRGDLGVGPFGKCES
ncbi:MAG: type II secretion system protein [Planctomycetota bacterium]